MPFSTHNNTMESMMKFIVIASLVVATTAQICKVMYSPNRYVSIVNGVFIQGCNTYRECTPHEHCDHTTHCYSDTRFVHICLPLNGEDTTTTPIVTTTPSTTAATTTNGIWPTITIPTTTRE